jgi:5-methylcytosine-specific restriction endonuclease McrA
MSVISSSPKKKAYDAARVERLRDRLSAQSKRRYLQNREARIAASKDWVAKHPEARRAIAQNYKHRRRAQEKDGMTGPELNAWTRAQPKICFWCGVGCEDKFHVDHYVALANGGKHEADNLVIACQPCNSRKSSKDTEQFMNEVLSGMIPHIHIKQQLGAAV